MKDDFNFLNREYHFSSRTLTDWGSFCREVAIDEVMNNPQKIGGPGIVVEIDESKFGKIYYSNPIKTYIYTKSRKISQR